MHSIKHLSLVIKKQPQYLIKLLSFLILLAIAAYSPTSEAITNTVGIEIELIPEAILAYDQQTSESSAPDLTMSNSIDVIEELSLWERIKTNYAMSEISSVYTTKHQDWYISHPGYLDRMIKRSEKYLFYIVEEVEKRNMPSEIALLPMIESAYNPRAYSRSHAAGIWQFIPSTGRHYGLKQNWWVDNRRNVVASTTAALDYLQKLHEMFGDWHLALAAYNAGEGTVGRAIARNEALSLPTDYQSLNLPAETRNYVPKLQAIKNIISQPQQYGVNISPIVNQAYFAKVQAPDQIDSAIAAELAGISHDEFLSLNPSFNRPVVASKREGHHLLLPIEAVTIFETNLANYDKPLSRWKPYLTKRGEKITNIAKSFKTSSTKLKKINNLTSNTIKEKRPILVPNNTQKEANFLLANLDYKPKKRFKKRSRLFNYKVKKGDTISGIAQRYRMKSKQILKMNRLKSTKLKIGQLLKLTSIKSYSKKRRKISRSKKRISTKM